MRLYQLEYKYESATAGITKKRSFFYRPEYVVDGALWSTIRRGTDIKNDEDVEKEAKRKGLSEVERKKERERLYKEMLEKPKDPSKSARHKYR